MELPDLRKRLENGDEEVPLRRDEEVTLLAEFSHGRGAFCSRAAFCANFARRRVPASVSRASPRSRSIAGGTTRSNGFQLRCEITCLR